MDDSIESDIYDASAIEGWTKEEKFYLLQALKTYGSLDMVSLQECLVEKSVPEIKAAIGYYRQRALKHRMFETTAAGISKRKRPNRVPLASWAKLITESLSFDELRTETSIAIQMIADLENHPDPASTSGFDFKAVYQQIANAMEGKPLVHDKMVMALLDKCIAETALASKSFIKNSACKLIIQSVDMAATAASKDIQIFPRPTDNQELAILRHLAAQRRYNPFKIPEDYLKPTSATIYEGTIDINTYAKDYE